MAPDGQIAIGKDSAAAPSLLPITRAASVAGGWFRFSALLCFAAATFLWLGPYLWRADLVSEDAAQHIFWFWRFVDPALLANDPATAYFSSLAVAPWGYRGLYASIVPALGPQLAGELVAVALLGVSCVLAWKTGLALARVAGANTDANDGATPGELHGLIAVALLLFLVAIRPADLISAIGFQRSFALPITLLAAWALLANRPAWAGVSWLLAALFYPVIVPVLGLAAGAVFLAEIIRHRRLPAAFAWNVFAGVATIAIVLYSSVPEEWIGPAVTLDQARSMPEFGAGGRLALESGSWRFWVTDHRYGIGWPPWVLAAFALAALAARPRRVPLPAWAFAVAGLALWLLAHFVLFHLYLPNRHSRTAVAVSGLVVLVVAIGSAFHRLHARTATGRMRTSKALQWGVAYAAPVLVAAALFFAGARAWQTPVNRDLERVYEIISALPAGTVVAAHPELADFVPLRTGRAVLASNETALPFMPGYYAVMKPRVEASLHAAYAESWDALVAALKGYPVDVVLLGPAPRPPQAQLPPFDAIARTFARHALPPESLVAGLPSAQVLLRSGGYYLVRLHWPPSGTMQARVAPLPRSNR